MCYINFTIFDMWMIGLLKKMVGFFSFCLFLGVLVKRSAFAIGFLFVWNIIEGIANGILTFKVFPKSDTASQITQFFPLESMSNLIVEPFTKLSIIRNIKTTIGANDVKDYSVHFTAILIVLAWTALFIFLSYKIIKKRDL